MWLLSSFSGAQQMESFVFHFFPYLMPSVPIRSSVLLSYSFHVPAQTAVFLLKSLGFKLISLQLSKEKYVFKMVIKLTRKAVCGFTLRRLDSFRFPSERPVSTNVCDAFIASSSGFQMSYNKSLFISSLLLPYSGCFLLSLFSSDRKFGLRRHSCVSWFKPPPPEHDVTSHTRGGLVDSQFSFRVFLLLEGKNPRTLQDNLSQQRRCGRRLQPRRQPRYEWWTGSRMRRPSDGRAGVMWQCPLPSHRSKNVKQAD